MGRQRWQSEESSEESDASEYSASGRPGKRRSDEANVSARLRPRTNRKNVIYRDIDSEVEDFIDEDAEGSGELRNAASNPTPEIVPVVLYNSVERFLARRLVVDPSLKPPVAEAATPVAAAASVQGIAAEAPPPSGVDASSSPPTPYRPSAAAQQQPKLEEAFTEALSSEVATDPVDTIIAAAGSGNTPLEESAFSDVSPSPQVPEPVEAKGKPSSRSLYTSQPAYRGTRQIPPPGRYEYLVKYYQVSYLHCEWLPEWEVRDATNLDRALRTRFNNFVKRIESGLEVPETSHLDSAVERVVDSTDVFRALYPTKAAEGNRHPWISLCLRLVDALVCFVKDYRAYGIPFLHPVDEEADGAPNYYQVVKLPMDFSTIQTRLYLNQYTSPQAFWADVKLVFSNCHEYNAPNTEICVRARLLEALFDKLYLEWANESRGGNRGATPAAPPPAAAAGEDSLDLTLQEVIDPYCFATQVKSASRRMLYQVKWKGRSYSETSWELAEDIADKMKIAQYHRHVRVPEYVNSSKGPGSIEQELQRRMIHETLLHVKAAREYLLGNMRADQAALPALSSSVATHHTGRKYYYNNPDFQQVRTGRSTVAALANAAADREQQEMIRQHMIMMRAPRYPYPHPFSVPYPNSPFLPGAMWAALQQQDPAAYAAAIAQQAGLNSASVQHFAAQQQAHRRLVSTQQPCMAQPGMPPQQQPQQTSALQQGIPPQNMPPQQPTMQPPQQQPPPQYAQQAYQQQMAAIQQQQQYFQQQQQLHQQHMQHQQQQQQAQQQAQQQPSAQQQQQPQQYRQQMGMMPGYDPSQQQQPPHMMRQMQPGPQQPPPPQCEGADDNSIVELPEVPRNPNWILELRNSLPAGLKKRLALQPLSPYEQEEAKEISSAEKVVVLKGDVNPFCEGVDGQGYENSSNFVHPVNVPISHGSVSVPPVENDDPSDSAGLGAEVQPSEPTPEQQVADPVQQPAPIEDQPPVDRSRPATFAARSEYARRFAEMKRPKPPPPTISRHYPASPVYKGGRKLFQYQLDGINWALDLWSRGVNGVLADEMGLGKTVQSVAILWHLFSKEKIRGPFLVVAPLSTLDHWRRTAEDWTDLNVVLYYDENGKGGRTALRRLEWFHHVLEWKGPQTDAGPSDPRVVQTTHYKFQLLLTSYEIFVQDADILVPIPWQYVIVDEAHRLKNRLSKTLNLLKQVACRHTLLLTGTPVQNNTEELWPLLNYIEPVCFCDLEAFKQEFGDLQTQEQVGNLMDLLRPHLLRRVKEDVADSIPPLEETIIDVELTILQKAYYKAIYERNKNFLFKHGRKGQALPSLMNIEMELRKCCNHPFMVPGVEQRELANCHSEREQFKKLVESSGKFVLLDKLLPKLKAENHKVLIFSQFQHTLCLIQEFLIHKGYHYERLDGQVKGNERTAAINRFNDNTLDRFVFLLSTRAGGLGINLTSADTVIIFDSDWNPQNDVQATARAHRIGQEREVKVYRLVTARTYESDMFDRASKKLGLNTAVFHRGAFDKSKPGDAIGSGSKAPSKEEVEDLLKKGAFYLLEKGSEAARQFQEGDIEEILSKNSRLVRYQLTGTSSTFAKTSFRSDKASDLSFDDPNFWEKVLNDSSTRRLLTRLNDGSATATPEAMELFMEDLQAAVEGIAAEDDPEPVIEALVQASNLTTFSQADRDKAEAWLSRVNAAVEAAPASKDVKEESGKNTAQDARRSRRGRRDAAQMFEGETLTANAPEALQRYERRLLRMEEGEDYYSDSVSGAEDDEDDAPGSKKSKKRGTVKAVRRGGRARKPSAAAAAADDQHLDAETVDQALQAGVPLDQLGIGVAAKKPRKKVAGGSTTGGGSGDPRIPRKRQKVEDELVSVGIDPPTAINYETQLQGNEEPMLHDAYAPGESLGMLSGGDDAAIVDDGSDVLRHLMGQQAVDVGWPNDTAMMDLSGTEEQQGGFHGLLPNPD